MGSGENSGLDLNPGDTTHQRVTLCKDRTSVSLDSIICTMQMTPIVYRTQCGQGADTYCTARKVSHGQGVCFPGFAGGRCGVLNLAQSVSRPTLASSATSPLQPECERTNAIFEHTLKKVYSEERKKLSGREISVLLYFSFHILTQRSLVTTGEVT